VVGGAGSAATVRANPAPRALRLQAVADTDSLVARRDTLARLADSLVAAGDSSSADSVRALIEALLAGPADTLTAPDSTALPPDTLPGGARDTVETIEFPDHDERYDELVAIPGFRVIEYRGRDVTLDLDEERVRLEGQAQAKYGASVLDAQMISYWIALQFINARRSITLTGEGQTIVGQEINYDVSGTTGTIMDARTSFSERGTEWFIRGEATPRGSTTVFVQRGDFTSCELEEPHYYFKSGKMKVVTENILVAWPVTLYIHDVPVAWLPFFAQDIRQGRRSGFLPPRFGVNDIVSTSSDIRRNVTDFGYYFAINDYMDAQTTLDWFSGDFTRVNTSFRYKSLKKFFQGNLLASYSFGDSRTLQIRANHQHDITPVTSLKIDANFVSNTRTYEEQSFNPFLQTQRISSDLGLQHRFPFASVNLSASRRQDLGTLRGTTDLTLPNLQMTFTPVTLFRAPRSRAGPFNNMTASGGLSFSRVSQKREKSDDLLTTRGSLNSGLRIGSLSLSGNANLNTQMTTPYDSLSNDVESYDQTRIDYGGTADYQIDLVGSTTLRPTVSISASRFQSRDTNGEFIAAPSRLRFGASLSTDVYGFLPGFGPFERIRHKVSPRFTYAYSPAVHTADSLLTIPGFPVTNSAAENRLGITLNQTFEAKLRPDIELDPREQALLEGRDFEADSLQAVRDSLAVVRADSVAAARADSLGRGGVAAGDSTIAVADSLGAATDSIGGLRPQRTRPPPQPRNIVLLGINSSQLDFDFSKKDEPKLVTDRWNHRINSDLLRGLSLNLSFDMFEGSGTERKFSPMLSTLTGSFSFSSSRGLGGLFGLGGGGTQNDPRRRLETAVDSRYRLQTFEENPDPRDPGLRGAGPWTLSLTYSLQRHRKEEPGETRQSLGAVLSLTPTPNWRLAWRTNYNLEDKSFGEHLVTLDRDLHRWVASFIFSRLPNGNFIFQMSVALRDAPDLKFDYDQRTVDR